MDRTQSRNLWIEYMVTPVFVVCALVFIAYMYLSSDSYPREAHDQGLKPIATKEVWDYQR